MLIGIRSDGIAEGSLASYELVVVHCTSIVAWGPVIIYYLRNQHSRKTYLTGTLGFGIVLLAIGGRKDEGGEGRNARTFIHHGLWKMPPR